MVGKLTINGIDIYSQYKVSIERIVGLHDFLDIKNPVVNEWKDEHGVEVYLDTVYYEPREITLNCFIEGNSAQNFQYNLKQFYNLIASPELKYMRIKDMVMGYLIYLSGAGTITRITKLNSSKVIGRFSIKLKEPYPVNRQFVTTNQIVQITISCTKRLTIWWGDGTKTTVKGTSQVKSKDYGSTGTRYIVIYGSVETITSITVTGATELVLS